MAVNLSPYGGVGAQFLDNAGNVLTGGKIFTYAAGTTTNQATFTSSLGNVALANPIILDAAGRVPTGEIWLTDGLLYKFVLKDSNDVLIATYDNISGINSNFVNFTSEQEIQTATAGQTVFTLTTVNYTPGTNSLSVFVDGVNQYGPGAQYAYLETNSTTVTFVNGLHVGASVKFTTATSLTGTATNANVVIYDPAGVGAVSTTVQAKLRETVSVKDFGAVGDGVADDTTAFNLALSAANSAVTGGDDLNQIGGSVLYIPEGTYLVDGLIIPFGVSLSGAGARNTIIKHTGSGVAVDTTHIADQRKMSAIFEKFTVLGNSNTTIGLDLFTPYISRIEDVRVMTNIDVSVIPTGSIGLRLRPQVSPLRGAYFNSFINVSINKFDIGFDITDTANANQFFGCSTHNTPQIGFNVGPLTGRIRLVGFSSENSNKHINVSNGARILILGWDAENGGSWVGASTGLYLDAAALDCLVLHGQTANIDTALDDVSSNATMLPNLTTGGRDNPSFARNLIVNGELTVDGRILNQDGITIFSAAPFLNILDSDAGARDFYSKIEANNWKWYADTDLVNPMVNVDLTNKAFKIENQLVVPRLTTTERDALTGVISGTIVYNTTDSKFQGRVGASWVDFH